jgi:hypothetical protein
MAGFMPHHAGVTLLNMHGVGSWLRRSSLVYQPIPKPSPVMHTAQWVIDAPAGEGGCGCDTCRGQGWQRLPPPSCTQRSRCQRQQVMNAPFRLPKPRCSGKLGSCSLSRASYDCLMMERSGQRTTSAAAAGQLSLPALWRQHETGDPRLPYPQP